MRHRTQRYAVIDSKFKWLAIFTVLLSSVLFASNAQSAQIATLDDVLKENRGKVIYLDFWASWCVPCRKSFPWMNKIQQKYQTEDFTVVSVNVDKEAKLAEAFLKKLPANFPVIYDPDGELAAKYRLQGMPSSFLINRQGKFVIAHTGFFEKKIPMYESEIEKLLSQPKPNN